MTSVSALPLLARLRTALEGGAPVRLDMTDDGEPRPVPDGTAAVVRTSGSTTGTGRAVVLSAAALRHSATATQSRLAGPGQWLLALPAEHIAGLQVLVRSILAGHDPVVLAPGRFDPEELAAGIASMRTDVPRYVSLVPTQLHRALAAGPNVCAALATCAAVLVGGAATAPDLLDRAREAGIAVVSTYGMTETCGGCVYDGLPLEGVRVRVHQGRVLIAGPVLATGYLEEDPRRAGERSEIFSTTDGVRWFHTADAGRWQDERLQVLGRMDDVIVSGGVNVHPGPLERLLAAMPGIGDVVVVGVPDAHWGELVTAVATGEATPPLAQIRTAAQDRIGPGAQVPRALVVLDELPLRGPGKVDRARTARLAAAALARGDGQHHPV